jgi:DNA-binding NarL/FixJ family response regulator
MLADVTAARSTLCEVSQRICDALAQGQSINEIAQSLNMSWHTVRKHIDAIRERFIEVGLDEKA